MGLRGHRVRLVSGAVGLTIGVALAVGLPGQAAWSASPPVWSKSVPQSVVSLASGDHQTVVGGSSKTAAARLTPSAQPTASASLTGNAFVVSYAASVPEQAKPAIMSGLSSWAAALDIRVPISVDIGWERLPGDTLAGAAPLEVGVGIEKAPNPNVLYPLALLNQLTGTDLDPGQKQIGMVLADRPDWHFGTSGPVPNGTLSLASVVRHEVVHGLGFFSQFDVDSLSGQGSDGSGIEADVPTIYDTLVADSQGRSLTDTSVYPNPSLALARALTSGALHWAGAKGTAAGAAATSRRAPVLQSPRVWNPGSSVTHLDELTYPAGDPDSLTTAALGLAEGIDSVGTIALAMLADEGWNLASIPQPTTTSTSLPTSGTTTTTVATTTTAVRTTTSTTATSTTSTTLRAPSLVGGGQSTGGPTSGAASLNPQVGTLARTGLPGLGWLLSRTAITLLGGLILVAISREQRRRERDADAPG